MADADTDGRPNVLLVLTDQERYDCTSPDGPPVETRNLDRLSDEGMRFERAFTPISICTSTRASLLTGLYPHNHGMINNSHEADSIQPNLPLDLPTFSGGLREAGYELTYTGKWHVGRDQTPTDFGFRYLGGSDVAHDDIDVAFRWFREEAGFPLDSTELEDEIYTSTGTLVSATTPVPARLTRPSFLADRAIEALEYHAGASDDADEHDADDPFFHRIDFYGPHHPYVVPDSYASTYDPDDVELPETIRETFDGKPQAHENYVRYRGVESFDGETWAEVIAKYRGFLTLIDEQIGRILDRLEALGLADDTVVVHTADHGDFVGGHRQFNKGPLMYDDTYRIPLQVRWPGVVDPGSTCEAPVHLHDLAPTFLDVAGTDVPDSFQTRSLLPILESGGDAPADWPDSAFAQYHGDEFGLYTQRMVRTREHKYVYNGPDRDELYDLAADPAELQNLIDHPDYADVRRAMRERLIAWMDETDDSIRKWVPKALGWRT